MLRHIVILGFRPDAPEETIERIVAGLRALEGRIDGLLSLRCERDMGLSERSADLVLEVELSDADAWHAYQVHPEHQAVIGLIATVVEQRAAVQYLA